MIPRKDIRNAIRLEMKWIDQQILERRQDPLYIEKLKKQRKKAEHRMKIQVEAEEALRSKEVTNDGNKEGVIPEGD